MDMTGPSNQPPQVNNPQQASGPRWMRFIPLLTGILAAAAGFLTVRGADLANQAIYHSNQAVLYQAKASDTWTEYQADSIKARVVETTLTTGVGDQKARDALDAQSKDLRARQPPLKEAAQGLEKKREAELTVAGHRLSDKDILAYAGVAIQLGIVLASIAAITRQYALFVMGVFGGLAGLIIMVYGLISSLA